MIVIPFVIQSNYIAKRKSGAIAGTDFVNQVVDSLNGNSPTQHAGSDNSNLKNQFAMVVKVNAPVSGQLGRFTAKEFHLGDARTTLSGALAEADIGTFPSGDDCIALDLDAISMARLGFRLGADANSKTIVALAPRGYFPVKVQKTGGSDGTQSTKASWVYTVKDLAGNTLGTSVALSHERPNGKAAFGPTDSYGQAFYNGTTLVLWDANEVYGTGACP